MAMRVGAEAEEHARPQPQDQGFLRTIIDEASGEGHAQGPVRLRLVKEQPREKSLAALVGHCELDSKSVRCIEVNKAQGDSRRAVGRARHHSILQRVLLRN